jgi:hypothetical protein
MSTLRRYFDIAAPRDLVSVVRGLRDQGVYHSELRFTCAACGATEGFPMLPMGGFEDTARYALTLGWEPTPAGAQCPVCGLI